MGSCASIRRKSDSSGKICASLVHSETDKNRNSMPCTSVKNNPANILAVDPSFQFSNYEEAFFDSQPWIESDCDDDFYSVKGDFTPSRGSTPIHSSRAETSLSRTLSPQVNRAFLEERSSVYEEPKRSFNGSTQEDSKGIDNQEQDGKITYASPSSEKKKNKLGDLFDESTRENTQDEFKSGNTTPYLKSETKQQLKSAQCCFPRLPSPRVLKKTPFVAPPPISVDA